MCGIARKTSGTVANCIPRVVAGLPWQRGAERVKQVVESPGHEHVVVGAEHERNHHCGKPHTWGQTKKEWDTRNCFLPPCPSLSLLTRLILEQHLGLFRGSEMFSLKKNKIKPVTCRCTFLGWRTSFKRTDEANLHDRCFHFTLGQVILRELYLTIFLNIR